MGRVVRSFMREVGSVLSGEIPRGDGPPSNAPNINMGKFPWKNPPTFREGL